MLIPTPVQAGGKGVLSLPEDDPQAIEMVIRFLYHLDYDAAAEDEAPQAPPPSQLKNGNQNGTHEPSEPSHEPEAYPEYNGQGPVSPQPAEEAHPDAESVKAEDLNEFLPINVSKSKNKRKKRKKFINVEPTPPASEPTPPGSEPPPETPAAEQQSAPPWSPSSEPASVVFAPPESQSSIAGDPHGETPHSHSHETQGSLATHAKVYALSKKYGIASLQGLALDKFEAEAREDWDTDDFLQAVREVYTAPGLTDAADRSLRDVVTAVVFEHPELLDEQKTQEVIRGLDLGYDLLMHVRKHGGFRSGIAVGKESS